MSELLLWQTKKIWREQYPGKVNYLIEGVALFLGVLIYWYTAQAFSLKVNTPIVNQDYFSFVLIGEISLLMPLGIMMTPLNTVRGAIAEGYLESYLLLPRRFFLQLAVLSLGQLPILLFRYLVTVLFAKVFFSLNMTALALVFALALQILCWPLFMGLGLIFAAVFIHFGRGATLLAHAEAAFTIFAGAYFPLAVLPRALHSASDLTPLTALLSLTRDFINGTTAGWFGPTVLLIWALLAIPCGIATAEWAIERRRHSGRKFSLTGGANFD